jgi:hypothetical protein
VNDHVRLKREDDTKGWRARSAYIIVTFVNAIDHSIVLVTAQEETYE